MRGFFSSIKKLFDNQTERLFLAIEEKDLPTIQKLVSEGCDLTVEDKFGNTPIEVAAKEKNVYFMNSGRPMYWKNFQTIYWEGVKTIIEAAYNREQPVDNSVCSARFERILLIALKHREFSIVRLLLEREMDMSCTTSGPYNINTGTFFDRNSILHVAVDVEAPDDVISLLIEHGADLTIENSEWKNPVEYAAYQKKWACLDSIRRATYKNRENVESKACFHEKPEDDKISGELLYEAVSYNMRADEISYLVNYKTLTYRKEGMTAIEYAATNDAWGTVRAIIEAAYNSNINVSDLACFSNVLLQALKRGKHSIARLLLQQKIDASHIDTETGDTVLHMAVRDEASIDMILTLLRYGANPRKANNDGLSALDLVSKFPLKKNLVVAHELSAQLQAFLNLWLKSNVLLSVLPELVIEHIISYVDENIYKNLYKEQIKILKEITLFEVAIASCETDEKKSALVHTFVKDYYKREPVVEVVDGIEAVLIVLNTMEELYPGNTNSFSLFNSSDIVQKQDRVQQRANLISELSDRLITNGCASPLTYYIRGMLEPIEKKYLVMAKVLNEDCGGGVLTQDQLINLETKLDSKEKETVSNENISRPG